MQKLRSSAPQDIQPAAINRGFVRSFNAEGYHVEVDLTTQRLKLETPVDIYNDEDETELAPTIAAATSDIYSKTARNFVSASALAYKAKLFDDGLYAAADLAAQQGAGKYAGKQQLLEALVHSLADANEYGEISEVIYAAARLGGISAAVPAALADAVDSRVSDFLADEKRARPLAFYAWSEPLRRLFQQDRMLQSVIADDNGVAPVVRALNSDKRLRAAYEEYLTFVSKLTNSLTGADLRAALDTPGAPPAEFALFPASRAHETDLIKKMYGNSPIPPGFSLIDEMITRIRDGRLILLPTENSGWYDYQSWALEPLVTPEQMPEAARLIFHDTYREYLLELFRAIIGLTRETHVKQLSVPLEGSACSEPRSTITIYPELTCEPLASYYLRRAIAYRFVRELLVEMFGNDGLDAMRRITDTGSITIPLGDELDAVTALFAGAHATVQKELGLPYDEVIETLCHPDNAIEQFHNWAQNSVNDHDLKQDVRMMVPVFYDVERGMLKVWAVLGWATRPLEISFAHVPAGNITESTGRPAHDEVELIYSRTWRDLAYPISAEIYVRKLMNRDEFRAHCDRYRTQSAILANLA